jgi:hypothetical protein
MFGELGDGSLTCSELQDPMRCALCTQYIHGLFTNDNINNAVLTFHVGVLTTSLVMLGHSCTKIITALEEL